METADTYNDCTLSPQSQFRRIAGELQATQDARIASHNLNHVLGFNSYPDQRWYPANNSFAQPASTNYNTGHHFQHNGYQYSSIATQPYHGVLYHSHGFQPKSDELAVVPTDQQQYAPPTNATPTPSNESPTPSDTAVVTNTKKRIVNTKVTDIDDPFICDICFLQTVRKESIRKHKIDKHGLEVDEIGKAMTTSQLLASNIVVPSDVELIMPRVPGQPRQEAHREKRKYETVSVLKASDYGQTLPATGYHPLPYQQSNTARSLRKPQNHGRTTQPPHHVHDLRMRPLSTDMPMVDTYLASCRSMGEPRASAILSDIARAALYRLAPDERAVCLRSRGSLSVACGAALPAAKQAMEIIDPFKSSEKHDHFSAQIRPSVEITTDHKPSVPANKDNNETDNEANKLVTYSNTEHESKRMKYSREIRDVAQQAIGRLANGDKDKITNSQLEGLHAEHNHVNGSDIHADSLPEQR